jgi:hypothetical protein
MIRKMDHISKLVDVMNKESYRTNPSLFQTMLLIQSYKELKYLIHDDVNLFFMAAMLYPNTILKNIIQNELQKRVDYCNSIKTKYSVYS